MKWKNKGHEFDKIGNKIAAIKKIAIFCAGFEGKKFYCQIKQYTNIDVVGFIDNDRKKHSIESEGKKVFSLIEWSEHGKSYYPDTVIVVAIRDKSAQNEIIKQLSSIGYEYNNNLFTLSITQKSDKGYERRQNPYANICEFIYLYLWYYHRKLFVFHTSLSVTQYCNLNCQYCNSFMQYIKEPQHRELESVIEDIDCYFNIFDFSFNFFIMGGEPTVYPFLSDVLNYIYERYSSRIGRLNVSTNGLTVLSNKLIESIKRTQTHVEISDYTYTLKDMQERMRQFINTIELHSINYTVVSKENNDWYDYGYETINRKDIPDSDLRTVYEKCDLYCRLIEDKKLYNCPSDKFAFNAGIINTDSGFDLTNDTEVNKTALVEYNLGYNKKGYVELCRRCDGLGSQVKITPAVQIKRI